VEAPGSDPPGHRAAAQALSASDMPVSLDGVVEMMPISPNGKTQQKV